MRRTLALMAFSLFVASAQACDTYTSELWDPGVRTATYTGDKLVIVDKSMGNDTTTTYRVTPVGTGIPFMAAINEADEKDGVAVREYRGDLLIDMEAFTCH